MKITGLKEFQREIDKISKNVQQQSEVHSVSFETLFDNGFMAEHTAFSTFAEFMNAGGFNVASQHDFDALPQDQLDAYVASATSLDSWESMYSKAAEIYMAERISKAFK